MKIDRVTCNRDFRYEVGEEIADWSPFILESKLMEFSFDKPILISEKIEINFIYEGHLNIVTKYGINRLTDSR